MDVGGGDVGGSGEVGGGDEDGGGEVGGGSVDGRGVGVGGSDVGLRGNVGGGGGVSSRSSMEMGDVAGKEPLAGVVSETGGAGDTVSAPAGTGAGGSSDSSAAAKAASTFPRVRTRRLLYQRTACPSNLRKGSVARCPGF